MQDYGSLLTMKQAARVLFGESNDNARKRAIALLKRNDVDLIKNGRSHLVRRDVLQKTFGVNAGPDDNTKLRDHLRKYT